MTHLRINAVEVAGSEYLVQDEDGEAVARVLRGALKNGDQATLDMAGAKMLTTAFIRALFSPILGEFPLDVLRENVKLEGLSAGDGRRVKFVLDDLKLRESDPEGYDKARIKALEMT